MKKNLCINCGNRFECRLLSSSYDYRERNCLMMLRPSDNYVLYNGTPVLIPEDEGIWINRLAEFLDMHTQ